MPIDININNQNKHWLLIILEAIKNFIYAIYSFFINCIKRIFSPIINWIKKICSFIVNCIKRTWKFIAAIAAIIFIIGLLFVAIHYYCLYSAVTDIESKFYSSDYNIKYAIKILNIFTDWEDEYNNVSNSEIRNSIDHLESEAFKLIEDKAYAGDAYCQYNLGNIYFFNYYFIDNDYTKAAYWWNEAAKQGYTDAFNNIGVSYLDGIGVTTDPKLAIYWLKKGAEAGHALAQRNYGNRFLNGVKVKVGSHKENITTTDSDHKGKKIKSYWDDNTNERTYVFQVDVDDYETLIEVDIDQAIYWWKKSAAQGDEDAKEALQKIYN